MSSIFDEIVGEEPKQSPVAKGSIFDDIVVPTKEPETQSDFLKLPSKAEYLEKAQSGRETLDELWGSVLRTPVELGAGALGWISSVISDPAVMTSRTLKKYLSEDPSLAAQTPEQIAEAGRKAGEQYAQMTQQIPSMILGEPNPTTIRAVEAVGKGIEDTLDIVKYELHIPEIKESYPRMGRVLEIVSELALFKMAHYGGTQAFRELTHVKDITAKVENGEKLTTEDIGNLKDIIDEGKTSEASRAYKSRYNEADVEFNQWLDEKAQPFENVEELQQFKTIPKERRIELRRNEGEGFTMKEPEVQKEPLVPKDLKAGTKAAEFGKTATPEQVAELERLRDQSREQELKFKAEKKLQEYQDQSNVTQAYNEAIKAAKGELKTEHLKEPAPGVVKTHLKKPITKEGDVIEEILPKEIIPIPETPTNRYAREVSFPALENALLDGDLARAEKIFRETGLDKHPKADVMNEAIDKLRDGLEGHMMGLVKEARDAIYDVPETKNMRSPAEVIELKKSKPPIKQADETKIGKTKITEEDLPELTLTPEQAESHIRELLPDVRELLASDLSDPKVLDAIREDLHRTVGQFDPRDPKASEIVSAGDQLISALNKKLIEFDISEKNRAIDRLKGQNSKSAEEEIVRLEKEVRDLKLRDQADLDRMNQMERDRLAAESYRKRERQRQEAELESILTSRQKEALDAEGATRQIGEGSKEEGTPRRPPRRVRLRDVGQDRESQVSKTQATKWKEAHERIKARSKEPNARQLTPEQKEIAMRELRAQVDMEEYQSGADLGGRPLRDTLSDLADLWLDERGSFSNKPMSQAQMESLQRLIADAKRAGKKIGEFLKDAYGFSDFEAKALEQKAKELGLDQPIIPKESGKVIDRIKGDKYKGEQLYGVERTEGDLAGIRSANELRYSRYMEPFKVAIQQFREGGEWITENVYRSYIKSELRKAQAWEALKEDLKDLKRGLSLKSRKRIGEYAIGIQEGGLDIIGKEKLPELTPEEMRVYEGLRDRYERLYQDINKMRAQIGKRPLKHLDNYFTFFRTMALIERIKGPEFSYLMDKDPAIVDYEYQQWKATPFRFAKGRGPKKWAVETDPFVIFEGYARSALSHIHNSPIIAKVNALRTPFPTGEIELTKAGKEKPVFYTLSKDKPLLDKFLLDWSNNLAGKSHTMPPWLKVVDRKVKGLSENIAVATLTFNIRSAAIQPSALRNTFAEIGTRYTMEGIVDTMRPGKRGGAMEKSTVLQLAKMNAMMEDIVYQLAKRDARGLKRLAATYGMWPLKVLDFQARMATWNGGYRFAKNKLGMGEEAAINYADDLVTRSQASSLPGDLSPIQRNNLGKAFTLFQTFVINDFNFFLRDVVGKGNAKLTKYEGAKRLLRYVIGTTLINLLYEQTNTQSPFPTPIKAARDAAEEGKNALGVAWDVGMELMEPLPIVGNTRYGKSLFGAVGEAVGEATPRLFRPRSGEKGVVDEINAFYDNLEAPINTIDLIGKVTGVPATTQATKMVKAVRRGEDPFDVVMGNYTKDKTGLNVLKNMFKNEFSTKLK